MLLEDEVDVLGQGAVIFFCFVFELFQNVTIDGYADFFFQGFHLYHLWGYYKRNS